MYIYIERERKRERERDTDRYIYIYICTHMYVYTYICILGCWPLLQEHARHLLRALQHELAQRLARDAVAVVLCPLRNTAGSPTCSYTISSMFITMYVLISSLSLLLLSLLLVVVVVVRLQASPYMLPTARPPDAIVKPPSRYSTSPPFEACGDRTRQVDRMPIYVYI